MRHLKKELLSLISKNKSLLKFAYLDVGGLEWHRLRSKNNFKVGNRELAALKKIAKSLSKKLEMNKSKTLIHIGPGNGVEIPIFFKLFNLKKNDTYAAVDLSKKLLEITISQKYMFMQKCGVKLSFHESDVEDQIKFISVINEIKKTNKNYCIIAASGEGTLLSNVEVLKNFSTNMGKNDILILSIDGINKKSVNKVCKEYDSKSVHDFLIQSLKFAVAVGALKSTEGKFAPTKYEICTQNLIVKYKLKNKKTVVLLKSYKPMSKNHIVSLFKNQGLKVIHIIKKDGAFGVLAVKNISS